MRRIPLLAAAAIAALSFTAGRLTGGRDVVKTGDFGRLRLAAAPCAQQGRPLRELLPAGDVLGQQPAEVPATERVVFRHTHSTGELWRFSSAVDDEVEAEGTHYALAWDQGRGWVVADCGFAEQRRW